MIYIDGAFTNNRLLEVTIGMNRRTFDKLLVKFSLNWNDYVDQKKETKKGAQVWSDRSTHTLNTPKKKLFFILFALKTYATFDVLGMVFGVNKSQANRWFREYLPLLEKSLGKKCELPKRKINSLEEFLKTFPETAELSKENQI